MESWIVLLSKQQCVTVYMKYCPPGELTQALESEFLLELHDWLPIWLTSGLQILQKSSKYWVAQTPTINHPVIWSGDQSPQAKKNIPGMTFQEPRVRLPLATGKGQMWLWVRLIHHYISMFGKFILIVVGSWSLPVFLLKHIWGSFQVLAVKNSAVMNIWVHNILVYICKFLLGMYI